MPTQKLKLWRRDTQHDDIRHSDTQHTFKMRHLVKLKNATLCITNYILRLSFIMPNVINVKRHN
jgi:hypothetical protein